MGRTNPCILRGRGHNRATTPPAQHRSNSGQRIALARVKRATSQLARWHTEYEEALSNAHHLGVPDGALEGSGGTRRRSTQTSGSRTTSPSLSGVGHTGRVVDDERPETGQTDGKPLGGAPGEIAGIEGLRDSVPAEIRDVSFPITVRGYDRRAVDDYVKQVNRVIAELEVGRSPQAAVRHALDRVGEQTSGILKRAGETAEEIVAGARTEADETIASAKSDAAKIRADASSQADETIANAKSEGEETTARANAEAEELLARSRAEAADHLKRVQEEVKALQDSAEKRMRELEADTDAIRKQRGELVEEIRQLVGRLEEIVGGAGARSPDRQPSEQPTEVVAADDSPQ
jgi:DivIVA domain-containing protein